MCAWAWMNSIYNEDDSLGLKRSLLSKICSAHSDSAPLFASVYSHVKWGQQF